MRLIYVIDSLATGGAETSLAELAPSLSERGVELHILPLARRLDLAPRLAAAGATVHAREAHSGRVGNVRAVVEVARRVRPDLVHTTLYESDVSGRTAARLLRIPASTSLVTDSYGPAHFAEVNGVKLRAARTLDLVTARFATRFHAVSQTVSDTVAPRLRISPDRVDVIPRGRDPAGLAFRPADVRAATRRLLGIPEGTSIVLAVGRLEPAKGLGHLLRALPLVATEFPHAVVLIAGRDGRSTAELHSLSKQMPLEIRFLGHRSDVPDLLAAADVLCFPSEREGSPGTLIEAMAVGCPVVASAIPPVGEVVGTTEECAVLTTPVGDHAAIARALGEVLRDAGAWTSRLVQGRAQFERLYSIGSVSERMAQFFARAAEGRAT